ncbi:MAG TPA: MFS transporter [Pseudolabrys sp.]|nr:MFS transporter [Pseudolabrys sp.]
MANTPSRRAVVTALGVVQILCWGTSFYFPAVFAGPIVADTGWSLGLVVGGVSTGLLVAGLISPKVGRLVEEHGGRPVLLASACLYAAGLAIVGLAPAVPYYLLGWAIVGLGMGSGLYDAVFAALGRLYGSEARGPITSLTLFGGFASTICWPLSAFMIEAVGWRSACLIYAGLHLVLAFPLHAFAMRAQPSKLPRAGDTLAARTDQVRPLPREGLILVTLALILTIAAGIGAIAIVHMMIFLQARGLDFAAAVALATVFGPAQVGARVVERVFGDRYHPLWTLATSGALMVAGLVVLTSGLLAPVIFIIPFGAGYGISWVARGTVPLALFGPARFPRLIGRLAFPSLIVQALSPSAGALLIERLGVDTTIGVLTALAAVNVVLIAVLWSLCRPQVAGR